MVLNYTNGLEVSEIGACLQNKKKNGKDGIRNGILKNCSPVIEKYLV